MGAETVQKMKDMASGLAWLHPEHGLGGFKKLLGSYTPEMRRVSKLPGIGG